jgi:hypothetical protein
MGSNARNYNCSGGYIPVHRQKEFIILGARHHPAHGCDHQAAQDRLDQAEFNKTGLMRFGYGRTDKAAADQCQRSKLRGGQIRDIGHAVHGSPIPLPTISAGIGSKSHITTQTGCLRRNTAREWLGVQINSRRQSCECRVSRAERSEAQNL